MEQIFKVVGYNCAYQKFLFIINLLSNLLPCIYTAVVAFMIKYPSFNVKILQGENAGKIFEIDFDEYLCNSTLYEITKNPLKSINNWSYTYDLYCEKDYYNVIIASAPFVGTMIGTIIITPLSDKYGRKKVFHISALISLIINLNMLFAFGPIHIILISFFGGIIENIFAVCYSLFVEFFLQENNGILIGIFNAAYPLFGIFLFFFFFCFQKIGGICLFLLLFFIISILIIF